MPVTGARPGGLVEFSSFLKHVRHAILLLDPDLRVVACSPATLHLIEPALLPGSLEKVGECLSDPSLVRDCQEVLAGGEPQENRIHIAGRTFIRQAAPHANEKGRVVGVVVVIDEKWTGGEGESGRLERVNQKLEERIERRTRSLVQNQRHLRALASQLAITEQRERRRLAMELHDYLAQLLVSGKMRVGQLSRSGDDPERRRELLEKIEEVLDESLTYTRTLITDLSPTILYDVGLSAALEWLAEKMKQYDLEVSVTSDGDPPRLSEEHAETLFQVIRELLMNVAKHAGVQEAGVTLKTGGGELRVSVEDEGRGFSPEAVIQDPASSRKFGLFNIGERIDALGGELKIDSAPGRGSRVAVSLPLRPVMVATGEPGPDAVPLSSAGAGSGAAAEGRIRVLLADDHDLVRGGLRSVLEGWPGIEVVGEAGNGLEAVELCRSLDPDVVLMDVNMPGMNGIDATRAISRSALGAKIIGLSVNHGKEVARVMRAAGAEAFLTKDGSEEDLKKAIEAAVAGSRTT